MNSRLQLLKSRMRTLLIDLRWFLARKNTGLSRIPRARVRSLEVMGTTYGGWFISKDMLPNRPVLLSAGVGEDISFDLAFAKATKGRVILVDPTPRSVTHVEHLFRALDSQEKTMTFETGGQEIDISGLSRDQFVFVSKALFARSGEVTFYPPKDRRHVSYSIANIQHTENEESIVVDALTVSDVMATLDLEVIDLAKFDIEGVAADVVAEMLEKGNYPQQIMLELEELLEPTRKNQAALTRLAQSLVKFEYHLVKRHQALNFLFVRKGTQVHGGSAQAEPTPS